MSYPDLEVLLKRETPDELLSVMRSPLSMIPYIFFFLILVLIVFLANMYLPYYLQYIPLLRHFSPRLFAIFPLIFLLETMRRYHDNLYLFGENTVMRKEGRLSLQYNIPTVRYVDIRGVFVNQDIWGRILGYGTVYLGTAAQGDAELVIDKVPDPYDLARVVEQLRSYNLEREKVSLNHERRQD